MECKTWKLIDVRRELIMGEGIHFRIRDGCGTMRRCASISTHHPVGRMFADRYCPATRGVSAAEGKDEIGETMTEAFRDNTAQSRFELAVDSHTAFVVYRKTPDTITLVRTEVPPSLAARTIKLARATLDAVRAPEDQARRDMRIHPGLHEEGRNTTFLG